MSAGLPVWPCALPACVLREGWSLTPDDPTRRTEMDDGAVAVRRRFHRLRTLLGAAWEMDGAQFELFQAFWATDLDGGAGWFEGPVFLGRCTETRRVRMAGNPPWRARSSANGLVTVTAEIELADLPVHTGTARDWIEHEAALPEGVDGTTAALKALVDSIAGDP